MEFEDANYADRLGWREIVVRNGAGAIVSDASVGPDDLSHELTSYPADVLSSPVDERSATFSFSPGSGFAARGHDDATRATRNNPDSTLARFSGLIAKDRLTPGVIPLVARIAARIVRSERASSLVLRLFPFGAAAVVTAAGMVILLRATSQF